MSDTLHTLTEERQNIARKYLENLTPTEMEDLKVALHVIRREGVRTTRDALQLRGGELNSDQVFKAFIFIENLKSNSALQERAFKILEEKELEYYLQGFVECWQESTIHLYPLDGSSIGCTHRIIPDSVRILINHDEFKFEHIKPFLNWPVETSERNFHLKLVVERIENKDNRHLTEEEIMFLQEVHKEYRIDATPLLSSIKHVYDMDGLPDEWVKEIYFG